MAVTSDFSDSQKIPQVDLDMVWMKLRRGVDAFQHQDLLFKSR